MSAGQQKGQQPPESTEAAWQLARAAFARTYDLPDESKGRAESMAWLNYVHDGAEKLPLCFIVLAIQLLTSYVANAVVHDAAPGLDIPETEAVLRVRKEFQALAVSLPLR